jgi:tRNA U34 2-thiouridine synthase MnmA/TrmU
VESLKDVIVKMKALALLSGGLDSTLAVKLILNQGVEVETINFVTPFCLCKKGCSGASEVAEKFHVSVKIVNVGKDYLKILRNPKHGYGRNMNPCIDCRIFMLQRAKKHAKKTGASFIFTGEVLDERPMSQHWKALNIIEKEAGLEGKILRPLSAKLLPKTEAEEKGWVDRERLLGIRGRSRKKQIELAKEFAITDYPCPAGGCLLTYKEYANKLRDLFKHKKRVSLEDVQLLKVGRHFRLGSNKIIVGRNERENNILAHQKRDGDYYFEAQGCGSPISLLQGLKTKKAIETAAALTAYYSDQKAGGVLVKFGRLSLSKSTMVVIPSEEEVDELRIKQQKISE